MFHNPKRRHSFSNTMSPVEYEKQYFQRLLSVYNCRDDSCFDANQTKNQHVLARNGLNMNIG
jgi:hypothetical protein